MACKEGGGHRACGAAYVFARTGHDWIQLDKLVADDAESDEELGRTVAVFGDTVVAGAPYDDDSGYQSGSAYVFERAGDEWIQQDKLVPDDAAVDDLFGYAVAIFGDVALVGAYLDDDRGSGSGSVYVFQRQPNGSWIQVDKLTASNGSTHDHFGLAVAIAGKTAVVGAPGKDIGGQSAGAAYVFEQRGDDWIELDLLLAEDAAPNDHFGQAVGIAGGTAVVGTPYDDDGANGAGSAYVFDRQGDAWAQVKKLTAADAGEFDAFGVGVGVSGRWAMAGAELDDAHGSAYAYDLDSCLCLADIDGSEAVDCGDLLRVLSTWSQAGGSADLNGDGIVDFDDLLIVLTEWGPCG